MFLIIEEEENVLRRPQSALLSNSIKIHREIRRGLQKTIEIVSKFACVEALDRVAKQTSASAGI